MRQNDVPRYVDSRKVCEMFKALLMMSSIYMSSNDKLGVIICETNMVRKPGLVVAKTAQFSWNCCP